MARIAPGPWEDLSEEARTRIEAGTHRFMHALDVLGDEAPVIGVAARA